MTSSKCPYSLTTFANCQSNVFHFIVSARAPTFKVMWVILQKNHEKITRDDSDTKIIIIFLNGHDYLELQ